MGGRETRGGRKAGQTDLEGAGTDLVWASPRLVSRHVNIDMARSNMLVIVRRVGLHVS